MSLETQTHLKMSRIAAAQYTGCTLHTRNTMEKKCRHKLPNQNSIYVPVQTSAALFVANSNYR